MTIKNYVLPVATWVDLNTTLTITVGTNISISNLGKSDIRIIQSAAQPESLVGDIITPNHKPFARATVTGGAKVWLYAEFPCEIAVQELAP